MKSIVIQGRSIKFYIIRIVKDIKKENMILYIEIFML